MYGSHGVLDQIKLITDQTVLVYGEDTILQQFQDSLTAHNALVDDMVGPLVETTEDRIRRFGTEDTMEMVEIDEYTRADAQKAQPAGSDVGFPLRGFQISLQWTRRFLQVAKPADLAIKMIAAQDADVRNVRRAVQRALFTPTNNLTYKDRMIDGVTLPVRALLNADGAPIPPDEFGGTFNGASHTHYMGTNSLAAADINSLLDNVIEHGVGGQLILYINRAQEAAVSGFANFEPLRQPLLEPGGGSTDPVVAGGQAIRPFDVNNRAIGVWNGNVVVYVKAWVPASYILALDTDPSRKVLVRRRRQGLNLDVFQLVAADESYPLRAQTMEREFGIGVWGRDNAAVLYTANATYAAPTIS